jgi:drug/metabolite transporter (DMT)-like permease
MTSQTKGLVIAYTALIAMGIGITVVPAIDMNSVTLVFYRALLTVPVLAGFTALRGYPLAMQRTHWLSMGLVGALTAAHWVTLFLSFKLGTVAIGIISFYTFPIFTTIIEAAAQRRKPRAMDVFLALFTLGGVALLTPLTGAPAELLPAVCMGLLSAVFWACRMVLVHHKLRSCDSGTLMMWNLVVITILLLPSAFYEPGPLKWDGTAWVQILFLSLVITGVCHTMVLMSLRHISATRFGQIGPIQIVAAVVAGWLFLGEPITLRMIIGAVIVSLAGLVTLKTPKPRENPGA